MILSRLLPLAALLVNASFTFGADPPKEKEKPKGPTPTFADVSFGPSPHQLLDIFVPPQGKGPFPVVIWYGGLWEPAKHAPDVNRFFPSNVAVVAVESRTLKDGMEDKLKAPIVYPMTDACRAVQFVRLNAAQWNLDPNRIVVGGGSQGSLPALFVGCAGERANPQSSDPVERASTKVLGIAAFRSQPTIDPKQMQAWVPTVEWGAPALGYDFKSSLEHYDEVLPIIKEWSPDHLLHKGVSPIFFENEWGTTAPGGTVTNGNYIVHSPAWGLGFKKLADAVGVTVYNKYLDHPSEKYKDTWDFLVQNLRADAADPRN